MVLVEFYQHNLEQEDLDCFVEAASEPILTTGRWTKQFEELFANYLGLDHVVGLNSCTAALHLSLLALGIGEGDEVITTPMTFAATALAIMHVGAKPVFVDVEPSTALIDVKLVEQAVTEKTRAILPVHLYGNLVDMRALRQIADRHGLVIVEDAAHCIEGERDGVRPGQLGDSVCFSFYATKNLACGEGGAVACRDTDLAKKLRTLSLHGMSKTAADRFHNSDKSWDIVEPGWKYNLDNLRASLLVRQVGRLAEYWEKRDALVRRYRERLRMPGPELVGKSAHHLHTIWVKPERRNDVVRGLEDAGVGCAVNYQPVHELSCFQERFGYEPLDFPVAHGIGQSTISLPLYPKLEVEKVDRVIEVVQSLL